VDTTGLNFGYYDGAVGLALEVANHAINNSRSFYHTSISGTQTVNRTNGMMDVLFAKTYKGDDGNFQMVVVNKSDKTGTSPVSNELSAVPKGLKPYAPNSVVLTKTSTSATLSWKRSPIPTLLSDFESTPDWTVHTGTWSVQTDDGSQAYVSSSNSGIQLATATSGPWDDYDADADIRVDSTTGFVGKLGVVGRFQDTNNYYSFVYDPVNDVFKLRKKVGGTLTTIATGTVGVGDWTGSYKRMRLSMISHNLKGYYDGNLVISATDSSLTGGSAGIITEAGQVAYFDRYIVRAPNDDHYILQRSLSPYSGYTTLASNITGTTYTDNGLDPSKTYYYRLQSVNSFFIGSNYYSSPVTKSGS
jgi:hypothetical protein